MAHQVRAFVMHLVVKANFHQLATLGVALIAVVVVGMPGGGGGGLH